MIITLLTQNDTEYASIQLEARDAITNFVANFIKTYNGISIGNISEKSTHTQFWMNFDCVSLSFWLAKYQFVFCIDLRVIVF